MFFQPFPVLIGAGVLNPVVDDLVIENVYFDEAGTVGQVMQFDMNLVAATNFRASRGSLSGTTVTPTSAFSRVRQPDADSEGVGPPVFSKRPTRTAKYGVVHGANVGAAAKGDVRVIGECTLTKSGSTTHTIGDDYLIVTGAHTVVTVNPGTASHLPIVAKALSTVDGTVIAAGTSLSAFFNGFAFGYDD